MNIALWALTGLLSVTFLASGVVKLTQPTEKLVGWGMGFAEDFSTTTVKAIGVLEILAAAGLVLPAALGIAPLFVPLAAAGLVLLMSGAIIVHLRRREALGIAVCLGFLALALLVAWGRFGPQSFSS